MSYQLTMKQRAWFDAASKEDRTTFLAQGPAYVPNLVNTTTFELVFRAAVRGFIMGDESFETGALALASAEKHLAEFKVEAAGHVLDERALGIDDTNRTLNEQLADATVRINWCVPLLGLTDALPEILCDWLDEANEHDIRHLAEGLPPFHEYLTRAIDEDEDLDQEELRDQFLYHIERDQARGCLISVSQPVPDSVWENGVSFSWGYTSVVTLYGDTFEEAMKAAIAWGKTTWEEGKAKAIERKKAKEKAA